MEEKSIALALLAVIVIALISAILWSIVGKLSRMGVFSIPIGFGILAAIVLDHIYSGELFRGLMREVFAIVIYIAIIMLGIVGTLICYLHAKLDEHDSFIKDLLSKDRLNEVQLPDDE